jgi:hypothetical protein
MKILTAQTQLTGKQTNSFVSSELQQVSVRALSNQQNDGETAQVSLSLSNKVSEEQGVATQSTVSVTNDEGLNEIVNYHESLEIAKFTAEQSTNLEMTVRNVFLTSSSPIEVVAAMNVEVVSVLTQSSSQNLTFEALGQVTTEDGRSIDFMLALDYERDISTEQVNQFVGDRNLIDPLMINLEGGPVGLSDLTFEFDLDSDGEVEQISQTASGSGFLVFDKNNNGEIDDGSEMFGPQSGQGFAELREYDDDGNGWIDENDAIYSELGVMSFSADGREAQTLMEAEVGAIFLGSIPSDYEMNTESGFYGGQITQSGVALAENGKTLLVQEVQLQVRPEEGINTSDFNGEEIQIDSPLGFFQFEDPLIAERNAETMVNIEFPVDSFVLSSQVEQASFAVSVNAVDFSLTVASAGQQTFDRAAVAQELSDWVASAMVGFEPRASSSQTIAQQGNAFFEIEQVRPSVFDNALKDLDINALKLESSLGMMRSMVDSLREMRQAMAQSQSQLSVYQSVGGFK